MRIKKSLVFLLVLAITICCFPLMASADVTTGDQLDTYQDGTGDATLVAFGDKTYWSLDGFWNQQSGTGTGLTTDVTGQDLPNICGNKFTVTSGYVGDLTCADNTDVIINGGSVGSITGGKSVTLNGGTVRGTISTSGSINNVGGVSINGQAQTASDPSKIDDISLDTSVVSIPMGWRYTVLCRTSRATAPAAWVLDKYDISVNTPVKTKGGWLYTVNATDCWDTELLIGSKAVYIKNYANARTDTTSVTLPVGARYGLGVSLHRVDFSNVKVSTSGSAASVNHGWGPDSCVVYTITAKKPGTSYVTFTGPKGNKATVTVTVKKGAKRSGNSRPLFCS